MVGFCVLGFYFCILTLKLQMPVTSSETPSEEQHPALGPSPQESHRTVGVGPGEIHKKSSEGWNISVMKNGWENLCCSAWRSESSCSLSLKGAHKKDVDRLYQGQVEIKERGNSFDYKWVDLDQTSGRSSLQWVVRGWNRSHREIEDASSLGMVKVRFDGGKTNLV